MPVGYNQDVLAWATEQARFVETARALGCDEDEAAFDEKLKVIARYKPKNEPDPGEKP